jgi:hypothetical protein
MLQSRHCLWLSLVVMAREFKPLRFFVMMALAAFVVCGVTVFYTHRAAHGRTAEERSAYAIGLKAGEQAPAQAILPTDAELNMIAQKYFKQQGSGDQQRWDLAFENGYTDGFQEDTRPLNQRCGQAPSGRCLTALRAALSALRFNPKRF